ncbi:Ack1 protein [Martiniozyma asiatica (nom. inval.)]|nr:Ack1 protein [Martiniozyma asiatica]
MKKAQARANILAQESALPPQQVSGVPSTQAPWGSSRNYHQPSQMQYVNHPLAANQRNQYSLHQNGQPTSAPIPPPGSHHMYQQPYQQKGHSQPQPQPQHPQPPQHHGSYNQHSYQQGYSPSNYANYYETPQDNHGRPVPNDYTSRGTTRDYQESYRQASEGNYGSYRLPSNGYPDSEGAHPQKRVASYQDNYDRYNHEINESFRASAPAPAPAPATVRTSSESTHLRNTNSEMSLAEIAKIQALEEKIQKLEKLMAMQQSVSVSPMENSDNVDDLSKLSQKTNDLKISQEQVAPPLPPPPPSDQRSLESSPKASLFLAEMDNDDHNKSKLNAPSDNLRNSASSLIPTDRSISDQSLGESVEEEDAPPPSYEELEKSGTLTYSNSIYRTGFEKAGYKMDHVVGDAASNNKGDADTSKVINIGNKTVQDPFKQSVNSKRKLPPADLTESMISQARDNFTASLKGMEGSSIHEVQTLKSESTLSSKGLPLPTPKELTEPISRRSPRVNTATVTTSSTNHSNDSLYKIDKRSTNESKTINIEGIIKFTTSYSYTLLNHGIIEPILPSKSKESIDSTITRFKTTRNQALKDYNQFTPKIQFYWAILLLETMSKQEVISRMAIDGKLRKSPLTFKKLDKQRWLFLNTAIKVLEKLIQIAPDETRAKLYLGDIYSGGIHPGIIEKDEKKGFQFFLDAATKQKDPVACYRVACCLESGVGCQQNIPKSTEFFQLGAKLGDPSSMCQLGMMYFAGANGCQQNINKSIEYHKLAYESLRVKSIMGYDPLISMRSFQDARGALYTLAKLYQTDRHILCLSDSSIKSIRTIEEMKKTDVWCCTSKSLKYYLEAAKLGHSESQASLGFYYSQGYFPTINFKPDKEAHKGRPDLVDGRKSIYWFSKAASEGHVYAALGLARWYGSGSEGILKKDEQQAFLWGRKAADVGELAEAEFMIGVCYETGFGVAINRQLAINYYERSARKGYKKAKDKMRSYD